jgi:hypothetical protein
MVHSNFGKYLGINNTSVFVAISVINNNLKTFYHNKTE